jgi:hypothetical protein
METQNSTLDDISVIVGFTGTTRLSAWFGGANLYIPEVADPNHPIAKLVGKSAFKALVRAFGRKTIYLPHYGVREEVDKRNQIIATLLGEGKGTKAIAAETGLTERRVQQLRFALEKSGHVPYVLKNPQQNPPGENGGEKSAGKTPWEKPA